MHMPQENSTATVPESARQFKVLAFYKFADLADCEALKPALALFCCARGIRGTFILAPEGINGTVAGTVGAIDALVAMLLEGPEFAGRLAGAEMKFSFAAKMPFLRMKVRLKPEIVTLRAPEANPALRVGSYVDAAEWNALLESGVTLVDTRNSYEVALGTFQAPSIRQPRASPSSRISSRSSSIRRVTEGSRCSAPAVSAAKRPLPICCRRASRRFFT